MTALNRIELIVVVCAVVSVGSYSPAKAQTEADGGLVVDEIVVTAQRRVQSLQEVLEARPSYNPEFDVTPDGFASATLGPSAFRSYGVKVWYNFF